MPLLQYFSYTQNAHFRQNTHWESWKQYEFYCLGIVYVGPTKLFSTHLPTRNECVCVFQQKFMVFSCSMQKIIEFLRIYHFSDDKLMINSY